MWEDGYCRSRVGGDCLDEMDGEDPVRKSFSKMSIQLYNYGEGWVLGRCCVVFHFSFTTSNNIKQMSQPKRNPNNFHSFRLVVTLLIYELYVLSVWFDLN